MKRKRSRKIQIDRDALRLLGKSDVFQVVSGWIWSFHGIWVTSLCFIGVYAGLREIDLGLNNQPIVATAESLGSIRPGRVVTFTGQPDPDERLEFESTILKKQFTLTMIKNTDQSVMIYERGIMTNGEKESDQPKRYTGRLSVTGGIDDRIDGNQIYILAKLDSARIPHADHVYVIAEGIIPVFQWWYLVVLAACAWGSFWILKRLILAFRCMGDRDLLYAFLTKRTHPKEIDEDGRRLADDR